MATLTQLKSKVMDVIRDAQVRNTSITNYLNTGVSEIASGLPSAFGSFMTPPLPDLFTIDTVDTDTTDAYVSMPDTFQRALVFAADEDGVEIDIANSWIEFASDYPLLDRSGSVNEVAEKGGNLYYQGIPTTSEEITVHFYRSPVDMVLPASTPDGIPNNFQERLLVNYAVYRIYELIEELEKASYYRSFFKEAMDDFELSLPVDTRSLFLI